MKFKKIINLFSLLTVFTFVPVSAKKIGGYEFLDNGIGPSFKTAIKHAIKNKSSKRFQFVASGCGTSCFMYHTLLDHKSKLAYDLDESIDAIQYQDISSVFESVAVVSNGKQLFISESYGVFEVDGKKVDYFKTLSSINWVINDENALNSNNDRFVGVSIGCGTECYVMTHVVDFDNRRIVELEQSLDLINALGTRKFRAGEMTLFRSDNGTGDVKIFL